PGFELGHRAERNPPGDVSRIRIHRDEFSKRRLRARDASRRIPEARVRAEFGSSRIGHRARLRIFALFHVAPLADVDHVSEYVSKIRIIGETTPVAAPERAGE